MLTLNQATSMTKGFTKWTVILVSLAITIFILFRVGVIIKNIVSPTPPPPPNVLFGTLPEIIFPEINESKNYSFTLDTITGGFPDFPDRAKVFKIAKESADLLALQKATEKARANDFKSAPFRLNNNEYQWTDLSSPTIRKLRVDIFSSQFSIASSYLSDPNVLSGNNLPNQENAEKLAYSFLTKMSLPPEELKINLTSASLLSISGSSLAPASSFADTKVIKIDFFHTDIDKLPVYYPNPLESTMNFYIAGGERGPQIILANFFYQRVSDESATYAIKTSAEAFEELNQGKAYIASPGKDDVLIQDISLAYYLSDQKQEYLLPIIVFKGNNGFVAYLSAIKDEWISK